MDNAAIEAVGKLTIDFNDFTIGEMDDLEDLLGVPFTEMGQTIQAQSMGSMKIIQKFVYVLLKRDHPDITLDEARDLKFGQINFVGIEAEGGSTPTVGPPAKPGSGTGPRSRSTSGSPGAKRASSKGGKSTNSSRS